MQFERGTAADDETKLQQILQRDDDLLLTEGAARTGRDLSRWLLEPAAFYIASRRALE